MTQIQSKPTLWQRIRLWFSKDLKTVDENTRILGQKISNLRKASKELDEEIEKVTQADALRSLVISMNRPGSHRR